MVERSRRPAESPRQTAVEKEQAVVELRRKYPDWGAAKLARVLRGQEPVLELQPRTVHRILDRRGLIAPEDRRRPAVKRFERSEPNELWQMDFKGPQGFNTGSPVGPLSVLDDHSRYLLLLRHLGSTRLTGVQDSLTETFQSFGMPESMLMDHGIPWWNSASPWGLTELSIWIMRLGIRLIYSGIRHPQTQGKVERMHGALQRAVRKRKTDPADQNWLNMFREEYNNVRPHEALSMATPASIWKPSSRAFPEQLKDWEYSPNVTCLRLGGDGQLGWCGRRWEISNALRRQLVGIEKIGQRAIVYFCRTPIRELNLSDGTATPVIGAPIRSLQY
jgi:transposase InsO family protein